MIDTCIFVLVFLWTINYNRVASDINAVDILMKEHQGIAPVPPELNVTITNNGPTILDSSITFFVILDSMMANPSEYAYRWYSCPLPSLLCFRNSLSANNTLNYTTKYYSDYDQPGEKAIFLYIFEEPFHALSVPIAFGMSVFAVTETINGNLSVQQSGRFGNDGKFVATGRVVTFSADIYDPEHFFAPALTTYVWKLGDNVIPNQANSHFTTKFDRKDKFMLSVEIKATVPVTKADKVNDSNYDVWMEKLGFFQHYIVLKDPIENITIEGDLKIKGNENGAQLDLHYLCSGSPPFTFCYKLTRSGKLDDDDGEYLIWDASKCNTKLSESCNFTIHQSALTGGEYSLTVLLGNDVDLQVLKSTVDVTTGGTGSAVTIIASVFVGMIFLFVVVILVVQRVKKRPTKNVEIADFDFHEPQLDASPEDEPGSTILARVRRSFSDLTSAKSRRSLIISGHLHKHKRSSAKNYGAIYSETL